MRSRGNYPKVILIAFALLSISFFQSCHEKTTEPEQPKERLWNQMVVDHFAAWSPDGSRIVYMREKAGSGKDTSWQFGAFIHDVTTGKDSCLWPSVRFDGFSWSPDSRKLAVVQAGQIYAYDFETDSLRQITSRNSSFSVSWNRCGNKLVFFGRLYGYRGMQVYDFESDSIDYVAGEEQTLRGDWMPNCSTIVIGDSCRYTNCGIYGYNYYTDSLWQISDIYGYKRDLAVSPDGQTVAIGIEHSDIWSISTSDGIANRLTTEGGESPDWSPDGQWIVYTKVDWYNGYLWLMRPDGSEKHQITF